MHFLFGFSSDWWFWVSFHLAYLPFVYCLLWSVGSSLCHKYFVISSFPESFRFIVVACFGLSFICTVGYGLKGSWGGVDLFCLHVHDQLPQHSLLKRLISLDCVCTFIQKSVVSSVWICFWTLFSYIDLCICLWQYHTVLFTIALYSES